MSSLAEARPSGEDRGEEREKWHFQSCCVLTTTRLYDLTVVSCSISNQVSW